MLLFKNMDLNDVLVFVKVATLGNFTRAAEYFGLPTSSISRKIGRLEEALGARLLERSTRSLRLTPMGKRFYQYAHQGLEDIEFGVHTLSEAAHEARGRLRISAPVLIGQVLLTDLMAAFMEQYPHIHCILELSNRTVDLIHEDWDLAIRAGTLTETNLIARKLGRIPIGIFASEAYLREHSAITEPSDLTHHQILDVNPGWEETTWVLKNQNGATQSIKLFPRLATPDVLAILRGTVQGMGVGKIPLYPYIFKREQVELEPILPHWQMPSPDVHALYPHFRSATPALRVFLDFLSEHLQGLH